MFFYYNIHCYMYKYLEVNNIQIYFSSFNNLKCTLSDSHMYPRLGIPALENRSLVLRNMRITTI